MQFYNGKVLNFTMKKIELLAPAGNLNKLKTAIYYGADAVYVGGEEFSLRTAADNFTMDELKEGIDFAHKHGVKIYLALNCFPHNRDIEKLRDYISEIAKTDIDAVIVSDLGAFVMVSEIAPRMEIHISTQANTVNHLTAASWYKMGAKRVVLARELTFDEIKEIRDKTAVGLELEMFAHGAMCMSYSGRCLLSNYMVGRDSNSGDCAQPCRWNYSLMEQQRPGEYMPIEENSRGSFIFNSKDLCLIKRIPELISAGVASLKIEGRVKTEYYVASVVKVYREAIDAYYRDPENYKFNPAWMTELEKVSHRPYWEGFCFGNELGQNYATSNYIREYDVIGTLKSYDETTGIAEITQRNRFFRGDEIEVISPFVEGFFSFNADFMQDEKGYEINAAPHAEMTVRLMPGRKILPNSILRKKRED